MLALTPRWLPAYRHYLDAMEDEAQLRVEQKRLEARRAERRPFDSGTDLRIAYVGMALQRLHLDQ